MGGERPADRLRETPAELPLAEVVPPRAVLTELARGFLLLHESDPKQAARFAASFLRERSTPPPESAHGGAWRRLPSPSYGAAGESTRP
jgi:hypothetical protein